ncbi:MAG: AraC family transcriptional regulator [Balneolaceae bacterium]|nr:MAG: AraC family transcriptional regulator [Balneolaceae bacterium]
MKRQPELPIDSAYETLESNLKTIDRVSEWAEFCNYTSSKKFSRLFRNRYGVRPIVIIKKLKLRIATALLMENDLSSFEIAREIGKRDEQALYHFFVQQTGNSPSFYRKKIREKCQAKKQEKKTTE